MAESICVPSVLSAETTRVQKCSAMQRLANIWQTVPNRAVRPCSSFGANRGNKVRLSSELTDASARLTVLCARYGGSSPARNLTDDICAAIRFGSKLEVAS